MPRESNFPILTSNVSIVEILDPSRIPIHGDYRISKSVLPRLPDGFVEIPDFFGNKKTALKQYRGPHNIHVLEYPDYWSSHRDIADPFKDPIGHLIFDSPEIPVSTIIGILTAREARRDGASSEQVLGLTLMTIGTAYSLISQIREKIELRVPGVLKWAEGVYDRYWRPAANFMNRLFGFVEFQNGLELT